MMKVPVVFACLKADSERASASKHLPSSDWRRLLITSFVFAAVKGSKYLKLTVMFAYVTVVTREKQEEKH